MRLEMKIYKTKAIAEEKAIEFFEDDEIRQLKLKESTTCECGEIQKVVYFSEYNEDLFEAGICENCGEEE
jgi:hypothetical protein